MLYDFSLVTGTDYRLVLDITRNVRFRKALLENITTYDYYDIQDGETPEIISEKIYGTPYYHWIIMLANQRYDYINDFPLAHLELEAKVDDLYGQGNRYDTHHYTNSGVITEGSITLTVNAPVVVGISIIQVGDILTSSNGCAARVNGVTLLGSASSGYQRTSLSCSTRSGNISVADVLTVNRGSTQPYATQPYVIVATSFVVNSGYVPVSNYDYENTVNESKRRIKIIDARLVASVLKDFSSLI